MTREIRVAILTVSDAGAKGTREDISGPALRQACETNGWPVSAAEIVPDQVESIVSWLRHWADEGIADLILTTGGTGIAARDVTPEATRAVLERELPGVAELMRQRGLEQTAFSVLSRAVAETRAKSLILNLPGSPAGALFSLGTVAHLVPHSLALLQGHTDHTGIEVSLKGQTGNPLPTSDI